MSATDDCTICTITGLPERYLRSIIPAIDVDYRTAPATNVATI